MVKMHGFAENEEEGETERERERKTRDEKRERERERDTHTHTHHGDKDWGKGEITRSSTIFKRNTRNIKRHNEGRKYYYEIKN